MLQGRTAETDAIAALVQGAHDGSGGALVIEADPGAGKTALLDAAASRAADVRLIRTAGLEAESSLPFSALAELAEPLLDGVSALPPPQAAAIQGALALTAPTPGDRFAACAGFHGLLANAAGKGPLLVIVDDAQWLDRASAESIGYAARRLGGLGVALLGAARAGELHPLLGPRVEMLELPGLARVDALALLREVDPELPESVSHALVDAAVGNPLVLIELPALLTPEQRAGVAPLEGPLPPGTTLQRAFEQRIQRLPPEARRACLVAATAFTHVLGPIQAACADLGIDERALIRSEEHDIVRLTPERIDFSHPLLRGAVYQGADAGQRRRAHLALAEHVDEDARAWHLAAAALGPDDAVADALEKAAERASERGAHGTAADALERAARLSREREPQTRRLLAAGLAAAIGGAYDRGATLMELADGIDDPVIRAAVRHPLAMTTMGGGVRSAHDTHALLTEEAERIVDVDAELATSMWADAAVVAAVSGNCRLVLASAERAREILPAKARASTRCHVQSVLGMGLALRGRTDAAREALDEAGRLLAEVNPLSPVAQSVAFGLAMRRCTGQEDLLRAEVAGLEAAARGGGAIGLFPYYQVLVADSAFRTGDWETAERYIAEAIEGAEESGQLASLAIALVIAARIHAVRGDDAATRSAIERAIEIAARPGYGSPLGWGKAALGFLFLSLDHPFEAVAELETVEAVLEFGGLVDPLVIPWAPDLVEAYSRVGRPDEAARVAAKLAEQATANGTPLALAMSARCEGLVADDGRDAFERALELHDQADSPFERARTLLAYGARLHRGQRRVEARERLREALVTFEELGAPPWAERARAELRAAGAINRERYADPDELTAQEVRVALAVSRGATNREVAADLYLSPKTIEFHLGRVYRKQGIHSRTELAAIAADGRLGHGVTTPGEGPGN